MQIKREAWGLIWLLTVAIFLIAGYVNDLAVQSEYDELNAEYKVVSEEKSDLQIKVFKRDLQIFKLQAEIVNLEDQIPK